MKKIKIKSERFILRTLTKADATIQYLSWFDGDAVKKHIDYSTKSHKDPLNELSCYILNKVQEKGVFFFGIFDKRNFQHIGNIKYEQTDSREHYSVMGILIGHPMWQGKGVAQEVLKVSALWLFQEKHIEKIILGVDALNTKAIHAYEKVGFKMQKTQYLTTTKKNDLTMVWNLTSDDIF
jgi:RimJ/RimL family protein N-acetyltransferase